MERESRFQDKLRDILKEAIKDKRFEGIEFEDVERDYPIDNREADIVLFQRGKLPFLIVETKRKSKDRRESSKFDIFSPAVIGQAISYAVLFKKAGFSVPFFATARPEAIAIFKTPKNVEDFVDFKYIQEREYERVLKKGKFQELLREYLIIRKPIELSKEFFIELLEQLAKDYTKVKLIKVELNFALIEQFRSFVEDASQSCLSLVEYRMKNDKKLIQELEKFEKEVGYKHTPEILSKMMAYVLMNKLIFYKVLENKYKLPKLTILDTSSSSKFLEQLNSYFERAIDATEDFEPIFRTGVYDMIIFPDETEVLERINDFIAFLDNIDIESIGELVGYIYEDLIPPEERHRFGQFYTPPPICELITKWAIRTPDDIVLDPGCGSGGFIVQAYKRLVRLKTGKDKASEEVHKKILDQLFAIDIHPFPAHLTAMTLSMKNVRAPSTNLNIIVKDFFQIWPNQKVTLPYKLKTAKGEIKRIVTFPEFDAVVGNPPYTRWKEISEITQKWIKNVLKKDIPKYSLMPRLAQGVEPGIYVYWIMHATKFLKEGGRLGMIISNLWLQTDYGSSFGQFLLDHYKIKAIIDFTLRLFTALISTCIILLEREDNEEERNNNDVVFVHIPGNVEDIDVNEILETIEKKTSEKFYVKVIKQKDIPREKGKKWITVFFKTEGEEIPASPLFIKLSDLFNVSRGNTEWSIYALSQGKRPDVGASEFAYLSPSKLKEFNLSNYAYPNVNLEEALIWPAITSARQVNFFTFDEEDWKKMLTNDEKCYMFIGHKRRSKLPKEVKEYIRWGETECRTRIRESRGGGRLASETESAKIRAKNPNLFYGWYDLGGVRESPIFAIRQARYKTRFVRSYFNVAMYDALISLMPKEKLTEKQLKALLAYLNSSFTQYYIESHGRYIAKGPIALEVSIAEEMPILDVRKLSEEQIEILANKFDELEKEARKIGGASEKEQIEKLKPKIYEIDFEIGKILGIKKDQVKRIQENVEEMIKRRITGSKEPSPEAVRGEEPFKVRPKKEKREMKKGKENTSLLQFIK